MAMEQVGYVARIDETEIIIRVARESACGGNCGACHGCPSDAILVACPNDDKQPYFIGEEVRLRMPSETFLSGTLLSYGLMTVAMLLGAILGYVVTNAEFGSVLGTFAGFAVGVLGMRWASRWHRDTIQVIRQNEGTK